MDVTMQYNGYNKKEVAQFLRIRCVWLFGHFFLGFTTNDESHFVAPKVGDWVRIEDNGTLSIVEPNDLNKIKTRIIPSDDNYLLGLKF